MAIQGTPPRSELSQPRLHLLCRCVSAVLVAVVVLAGGASGQSPRRGNVTGASVKFDARKRLLQVPVRVNDRQRLFLLDSGSSVSVFDVSYRGQLGEPLRTDRARTPAGGVTVDLFHAPRATIAELPLTGVCEVGCMDLRPLCAASGIDLGGIIGADFLRSCIVQVDCDRGEIAFLESLPENAGTPIAVYFLAPGLPHATLRVVGAGSLPFLVDTGINYCGTISRSLLKRLVEDGKATQLPSTRSYAFDQVLTQHRARVSEVSLGDFRHEKLLFREGDRNALGLGYFYRYIITFDFPQGTMYLKPGVNFDRPSQANDSGVELWQPNGITSVRRITPSGAADVAGLRAGDVILAIDWSPTSSLPFYDICDALCVPGKHVLRIARGEEHLEITLVLKELPKNAPSLK